MRAHAMQNKHTRSKFHPRMLHWQDELKQCQSHNEICHSHTNEQVTERDMNMRYGRRIGLGNLSLSISLSLLSQSVSAPSTDVTTEC